MAANVYFVYIYVYIADGYFVDEYPVKSSFSIFG